MSLGRKRVPRLTMRAASLFFYDGLAVMTDSAGLPFYRSETAYGDGTARGMASRTHGRSRV